jgi:hypothetical protein
VKIYSHVFFWRDFPFGRRHFFLPKFLAAAMFHVEHLPPPPLYRNSSRNVAGYPLFAAQIICRQSYLQRNLFAAKKKMPLC